MIDQTLISKALAAWTELTGFDPANKVQTINLGRLGTADELDMAKVIQTSIDLDPTMLSTAAILRSTALRWCRGKSISLYDLVMGDSSLADRVAPAKRLLEIVDAPEIEQALDAFRDGVVEALDTVGYRKGENSSIDRDAIGETRLAALKSISGLRHDLVSRGAREPEGTRPMIDPAIHAYPDLRSAVAAVHDRPSGISLVFLSDAHEKMHGYFAFLSRNGEEVRVISDKPSYEHPFQQAIFRRNPDVIFEDRIKLNRFPYGLLWKRGRSDTQPSTEVVDAAGTQPFGRISELAEGQATWMVMMLDLVRENVWSAPDDGREASFFAGDAAPVAIAGETVSGALALPGAGIVDLPPLTVSDVSFGACDDDTLGKPAGRRNAWMEERYGQRVDPDVLNLVVRGDSDVLLLQDGTDGRFLVPTTPAHGMAAYDGSAFGSRKEIERDRRYVARANLARSVQAMADEEFVEREKEIAGWYLRAVKRNVEFLHRLAACGADLELPVDPAHPNVRMNFLMVPMRRGSFRFVHHKDKCDNQNMPFRAAAIMHSSGIPGYNTICHVTGNDADAKVLFTPATARDLAMLAGKPASKLPDVLQGWVRDEDYVGNSNLDRIDPMASRTKNPWSGNRFDVTLWLSRSGQRKLARKHGADHTALGPFIRMEDDDRASSWN